MDQVSLHFIEVAGLSLIGIGSVLLQEFSLKGKIPLELTLSFLPSSQSTSTSLLTFGCC